MIVLYVTTIYISYRNIFPALLLTIYSIYSVIYSMLLFP